MSSGQSGGFDTAEAPAAGAVRMSDAERDATLMSAQFLRQGVLFDDPAPKEGGEARGGGRKGR